MKPLHAFLAAAAAAALVLPLTGPLAAEDLTDEEIRELFRMQREVFRGVDEDPELGVARGLVLVGSAPAAEGVVTVEPAPPEAEAEDLDLGGEPEEVATAETVPDPVWQLPVEQQVNVRVHFAFDSAAIREAEKPNLRRLCNIVQEEDIQRFRIIGHTDAAGARVYNQNLSELRAQAVMHFFIEDCDISADRLEAIGLGQDALYNVEEPLSGENRRVEFQAMG
jgi:OmpA-OmpF porin, OOP family